MGPISNDKKVVKAIEAYDLFSGARAWAKCATKINTALPKEKAKIWDEREKQANDRLEKLEKDMIDAVDSLNQKQLNEFLTWFGLPGAEPEAKK